MPFYFTCPYCFKKTLVPDEVAGQEGPCAGCGKLVTVPEAPTKPAAATRPVDSAYVELQPEGGNRRWLGRGLQFAGLLVLVGAATMAAVYLMWPSLQGLRKTRNRIACMNNLQKIAAALNAYADDYGTYPPPVLTDDQGRPMHSWRVLILPQLGYAGLHAQYNFSQPWDSSENAYLMARCPPEYISPAGDPFASESSYMLITGRGTVFPKTGPLAPDEILDGMEQTLLVVETENTVHEWTKPVDIEFGKLDHQIGASGSNTVGGNHAAGATAVFADGTPAWLRNDLSPVLLDALITPRGDEPVDPADYRTRAASRLEN